MSRKTSKKGSEPSVEASRSCVWRSAFEHLDPVVYEGQFYPDYVAMADGYAKAVTDRRVSECEFVIRACERYQGMRKSATAWNDRGPYSFSPVHVVEACHFVESCEGGEQSQEPLILEPFQCWLLANLFGFRVFDSKGSVRWFTEVLYDCTRGAGKTALFSRINLFLFLFETERASQSLIVASSAKQALKAFEPIYNLVKGSTEFQEDFGLKPKKTEIRRPDGGYIRMLSANGKKEDGAIPHVVHIDELHAVPDSIYEVITSSFGKRRNELLVQTTTAGSNVTGVGYIQRKRLERVLLGQEVADHFFGVIYSVDAKDMKTPLTWENVIKANPMLGVTVKEVTLRDALEAARFNPRLRGEFIAKRLNVYDRGSQHALSPDEWRQCEDKTLRIEDFLGQECWIGVDLSSHEDMTAIALLFEDDNDNLVVFAHHFLPSNAPGFSDEKVNDFLYQWANDPRKWLEVTSLPKVDYSVVKNRIEAYCKMFKVQDVIFDQAQSLSMSGELQKQGIKANAVTFTAIVASEPTKDLIVRARNKMIRHDGNPVLAWNAANVTIYGGTHSELWRPAKDKSAPHMKIDGISAAVHANSARLGRVTGKVAKPEKPVFDPNRIVRTFR